MAMYNLFKTTPKALQRYVYAKDGEAPSSLPTGVRRSTYGYIAELSDEQNVVYFSQHFRSAEEAGDWWQVETAKNIFDDLGELPDDLINCDTYDVCKYVYHLAAAYLVASDCGLIYGWNDDDDV